MLGFWFILLLFCPSFTLVSPPPPITVTSPISSSPISSDYESENDYDEVIEKLVGVGKFNNYIEFLSITQSSMFPGRTTLFMSTDSSGADPSFFTPENIAYHTIPDQISYHNLLSLSINSTIPTLLPNSSLVVTNNSRLNYTIDNCWIEYPDLFMNGQIAVHGIKGIFNYSVYGNNGNLHHHHKHHHHQHQHHHFFHCNKVCVHVSIYVSGFVGFGLATFGVYRVIVSYKVEEDLIDKKGMLKQIIYRKIC